jgi:hypothetical protein
MRVQKKFLFLKFIKKKAFFRSTYLTIFYAADHAISFINKVFYITLSFAKKLYFLASNKFFKMVLFFYVFPKRMV